jgi:phage head maturation protease
VKRVRKLFDVSAVSIPANPGTEISARSHAEGVIEQERLERAEAEERDRKVRALKLRLSL